MIRVLLLILLMVSSMCHAQYSNHQLYQAYLDRDMFMWDDYISSADWETMSLEEKKQLLNYEYGYSAYLLGQDTAKARVFVTNFEQHLEDLRIHLTEARYLAYLSSVYTYKMSLDKARFMSYSRKIIATIKRALELDDNDPLVMSMSGNVEFYNPLGSKKKALQHFQKADSLYRFCAEDYEQWNRRAVEMTIEQCLLKLNK